MPSHDFSPQALSLFLLVLQEQMSAEALDDVLEKSGFLAQEIRQRAAAAEGDAALSGEVYGDIQAALRLYYGRGARGLLQRVGQEMWRRWLKELPLSGKMRARSVQVLPADMRLKHALELAAFWLRPDKGAVSVHTLDRDFMVVSESCPIAHRHLADQPVCFLFAGWLSEAIHWASRQYYSVDEISCLAAGDSACEFKITLGV